MSILDKVNKPKLVVKLTDDADKDAYYLIYEYFAHASEFGDYDFENTENCPNLLYNQDEYHTPYSVHLTPTEVKIIAKIGKRMKKNPEFVNEYKNFRRGYDAIENAFQFAKKIEKLSKTEMRGHKSVTPKRCGIECLENSVRKMF